MTSLVRDEELWKDALTLEEWMRKAILEGHEHLVIALMKTLPGSSKERYRKVWAEIKGLNNELGQGEQVPGQEDERIPIST